MKKKFFFQVSLPYEHNSFLQGTACQLRYLEAFQLIEQLEIYHHLPVKKKAKKKINHKNKQMNELFYNTPKIHK